jgi:hypothetical protein
LTEHEYKEWFDKWLRDIESLDNSNQNSPFANAPKPFNSRKWFVINAVLLLFTLLLSLTFSYFNNIYKIWLLSWFDNAFLNILLGLMVSLLIFTFTNLRERNVLYYSDIIPLLKIRYSNLHSAFFEHTFKLSRYYQNHDYAGYYDAWHVHVNVCLVILNFYEYLFVVFPFKPKCFNVKKESLEKVSNRLLEANNLCQSEFFTTKTISEETYKTCGESTEIPYGLLVIIGSLIEELEQNLYVLKYNKKKLHDGYKDNIIK